MTGGRFPLLLAGGGSGVVPLLAMLRRRAQDWRAIPAALIYATRTRAEAIALPRAGGIRRRGSPASRSIWR